MLTFTAHFIFIHQRFSNWGSRSKNLVTLKRVAPFKGHQIFYKGRQRAFIKSIYHRFIVVCSIIGSPEFENILKRRYTKKFENPCHTQMRTQEGDGRGEGGGSHHEPPQKNLKTMIEDHRSMIFNGKWVINPMQIFNLFVYVCFSELQKY